MRKIALIFTAIIYFVTATPLYSEGFSLFDDQKKEQFDLFADFKPNKLRFTSAFWPDDEKKLGASYEYFFTERFGIFTEGLYQLDADDDTLEDAAELNLAASYRFTKRTSTWVFSGSLGMSLNNDMTFDDGKTHKGFKINHAYGRFGVDYTFRNGFGLDYSFKAKMPIEFENDDDMEVNHTVSLVFQF